MDARVQFDSKTYANLGLPHHVHLAFAGGS